MGATEQTERPRVSIAAEVRAWIGVGTLLTVNMIGGVWWAATLNVDARLHGIELYFNCAAENDA